MPSQSTSTLALLAGNLLPIVGVVLWDWDVYSIVTLYWTENLILGGIMLLKMFFLGRFAALGTMAFFLVHYGAFCFVHGVFISEFFAPSEGVAEAGVAIGQSLADPVLRVFSDASALWWWAFAALALSHLVSFFVNWLGQQEYRGETKGSLMSAPYRRIMILHATVLLGGIAITALGSPVYLVAVLVLVKIAVDLVVHRREHSALREASSKSGSEEFDWKLGEK